MYAYLLPTPARCFVAPNGDNLCHAVPDCRYLMAPMQQVRDELKDDISSLDDELKRLAQQQAHATKQLAATETEVQELFKSNPELTRQLMPASS